jgi:hypothetical protein
MFSILLRFINWVLTKRKFQRTVVRPTDNPIIFMETLESTLKISHDWAQDRITHLTDVDNTEDAFALLKEFEEWFDPEIDEHDIISMGVIEEEDS